MYKIQDKPYKWTKLSNGARVTPLVTLKDEYGGVFHIIEDDHCYVLLNGNTRNFVYHWFEEAVLALHGLCPQYLHIPYDKREPMDAYLI